MDRSFNRRFWKGDSRSQTNSFENMLKSESSFRISPKEHENFSQVYEQQLEVPFDLVAQYLRSQQKQVEHLQDSQANSEELDNLKFDLAVKNLLKAISFGILLAMFASTLLTIQLQITVSLYACTLIGLSFAIIQNKT